VLLSARALVGDHTKNTVRIPLGPGSVMFHNITRAAPYPNAVLDTFLGTT
jgi:hypothetical protein